MSESKKVMDKKINKILNMEKREMRAEFFKRIWKYSIAIIIIPSIYYLDSPIPTGEIYEGKVEVVTPAAKDSSPSSVEIRLDNGDKIFIESSVVQRDQRVKIQETKTRFTKRRKYSLYFNFRPGTLRPDSLRPESLRYK